MDTTMLVIISGFVLLAVVVAAVLLRRSWGDFPSDPHMPKPMQPQDTARAEVRQTDAWDAGVPVAADEAAYAQPSSGDLVLITNPNIRRAAEQALRKGDDSAKYFARDDDKVYFNAAAISDPTERRRAAMVMQRLGTDDEIDMGDVWQVIQMLRRS